MQTAHTGNTVPDKSHPTANGTSKGGISERGRFNRRNTLSDWPTKNKDSSIYPLRASGSGTGLGK